MKVMETYLVWWSIGDTGCFCELYRLADNSLTVKIPNWGIETLTEDRLTQAIKDTKEKYSQLKK